MIKPTAQMLLKPRHPLGLRCSSLMTMASRTVQNVFIISSARTPIGSFRGSLRAKTATELGAVAIRQAVARAALEPARVQEVMMGCVVQAGLGQAPARQAALFAGLSEETPCTTLNKVCASGMKAIMMAATSLAMGLQEVMVAGGMESLSNTPFYLSRGQTPYGNVMLKDACNFDALTDVYSKWHMGQCAENMAAKMGISRQQQDDYAELSYSRYQKSAQLDVVREQITPVQLPNGLQIEQDEIDHYDRNALQSLPTIWGDTITRGSSSKLADGAAACLLANEKALERYGLRPLAKVLAFQDSAQHPTDWPTSPAKGIEALLQRVRLTKEDIALWEINEAFAMVVLANANILGLDLDKVNVHGGAIAMGHPFGMSGARITSHLLYALQPGQLGVASLCNGGGGSSTILIQRV